MRISLGALVLAVATAATGATGTSAAAASLPSPAASLGAATPPRAEYAVRSACPAPRPGRAGCLALSLRPRTAPARARAQARATRRAAEAGVATAAGCAVSYPSSCLTPNQLNRAYFPGEAPDAPAGETQTIALVDAFADPRAEADLAVYSSEFGLPPCTAENGCFKQIGESGGEVAAALPFPKSSAELEAFANGSAEQRAKAEEAEGWALEIATDVEMAHAVCQNCHILLVAASSPEFADLEAAEDAAAARAGEVSNSWGGPEPLGDSAAFDHPGVAIVAAAGDDGYRNWDLYETRNQANSTYFPGADYPASSPHVVAVGGTSLRLSATGAWQGESPWNGEGAGGSGCSESLAAPTWQLAVPDWTKVGCGSLRASADVSAVADPATGVDVYDSVPYPQEGGTTTVLRWVPIGGTSVAAPIVAAMFALAGGAHGVAYPAQTLYSHLGSRLLHDVVGGGDGKCDGVYTSCSGSMNPLSPNFPLDCGAGVWICNATAGYDGPTGVGTPAGIAALRPRETGAGEGESQQKGTEAANGKEEAGTKGSGGEPPTENPPRGGQAPAESAPGSPGTPAPGAWTASPAPQPASSSGGDRAGGSASSVARVTRLALTARARLALRRGARRVALSRVAFSFSLSRRARVRISFAVLRRTPAGPRWRIVSSSAFTASAGAHRRHLDGARSLAGGSYRLTLTPAGGAARSMLLRVG